MHYKHNKHSRVQFDMLALSRWQLCLVRLMVPGIMLLIFIAPTAIIRQLWPAGGLGLAAPTLGLLLSVLLWLGGGFLLLALFRGAAMASAQQQQQLQRLFVAYPELHAYRDRVHALGRGFTVGEHETLMAWPAMKAEIEDELDSQD